jgi:hypothetical protein
MYVFFIKKDVTRVLSVFGWDVSCDRDSDRLLTQVLLMGCFVTGVLVNFD